MDLAHPFDPIPRTPDHPAWDGWTPEGAASTGAANVWSIISAAMTVRLHPRVDFERARSDAEQGRQYTAQAGTPYGMSRMPLVTAEGVPCSPPPFGKLVAFDLGAGRVAWERPVGVSPIFEGIDGAEEWGTVLYGGPLVTAGGLVFLGASQDDRFRAFDVETGEVLWEHQLPAGGQATPMTYQVGGRQAVLPCLVRFVYLLQSEDHQSTRRT